MADFASGVFEFTIRNGSTTLVGSVEALDGTIRLRPKDGTCYEDRSVVPRDEEPAVFKCQGMANFNDLTIAIDKRDPQGRSRWSSTVTRFVQVSECTAYIVNERGQQVCTVRQTRQEERSDRIGGTILLKGLGRGD
jgi:hypothetical protein